MLLCVLLGLGLLPVYIVPILKLNILNIHRMIKEKCLDAPRVNDFRLKPQDKSFRMKIILNLVGHAKYIINLDLFVKLCRGNKFFATCLKKKRV